MDTYPVKLKKTKQRYRYFNYFHIHWGVYTFLNKREKKDIWHNLYEFPLIETNQPMSFTELQTTPPFKELFPDPLTADFRLIQAQKKHILTHQILHVDFYEVFLSEKPDHFNWLTQVTAKEINNYPLHKIMEQYFELKK